MNHVRDRLLVPVSDRDHIRKGRNCTVVLVEYGDYQCPDSGAAHNILKRLHQQLDHSFWFVYRHFPQIHQFPQAQKAAEAAEAAAAQGMFWQMHDVLFEHQHALEDSSLVEYADRLNLDILRFLRDMSKHTYTHRVQQDIESGYANMIRHTPTLFINGIHYQDDCSLEKLRAAILEINQI